MLLYGARLSIFQVIRIQRWKWENDWWTLAMRPLHMVADENARQIMVRINLLHISRSCFYIFSRVYYLIGIFFASIFQIIDFSSLKLYSFLQKADCKSMTNELNEDDIYFDTSMQCTQRLKSMTGLTDSLHKKSVAKPDVSEFLLSTSRLPFFNQKIDVVR